MYAYACGIANLNDDWEFQGIVSAENVREAKKELAKFKKKNDIVGRCLVTAEWKTKTKRKKRSLQRH